MAKFKQDVIRRIIEDADLFAAVAKKLNIRTSSMPETLKRNGNKLNQYSIVAFVAEYLGMEPSELVEEELMGQ